LILRAEGEVADVGETVLVEGESLVQVHLGEGFPGERSGPRVHLGHGDLKGVAEYLPRIGASSGEEGFHLPLKAPEHRGVLPGRLEVQAEDAI
jgi:hypothetical protein